MQRFVEQKTAVFFKWKTELEISNLTLRKTTKSANKAVGILSFTNFKTIFFEKYIYENLNDKSIERTTYKKHKKNEKTKQD